MKTKISLLTITISLVISCTSTRLSYTPDGKTPEDPMFSSINIDEINPDFSSGNCELYLRISKLNKSHGLKHQAATISNNGIVTSINSGGGIISKPICIKQKGESIKTIDFKEIEIFTIKSPSILWETPDDFCEAKTKDRCIWNGNFSDKFSPSFEFIAPQNEKIASILFSILIYRNGEPLEESKSIKDLEKNYITINGMQLRKKYLAHKSPISIYLIPSSLDQVRSKELENKYKNLNQEESRLNTLLNRSLEILKTLDPSISEQTQKTINELTNCVVKKDSSQCPQNPNLSIKPILDEVRETIDNINKTSTDIKEVIANPNSDNLINIYKKTTTTFIKEDAIFLPKKDNPILNESFGGVSIDMQYDDFFQGYFFNPWFAVPLIFDEFDTSNAVLNPTNAIPLIDLIGARCQTEVAESILELRTAIFLIPLTLTQREGKKSTLGSGLGIGFTVDKFKIGMGYVFEYNAPSSERSFNNSLRLMVGVDLIPLITGEPAGISLDGEESQSKD